MKSKAALALFSVWLILLAVCFPASAADKNWSVGNTDITSISVSPDGSRVAIGSYDAKVHVFDNEGNALASFAANNVVTGVAFLHDGSLLVSSDDRHLYRLDEDGNEMWNVNVKRLVKGVAAAEDGSVIAVITAGANSVFLYDLDGNLIQEADIGIQTRKLDVSPDGSWIAVGGSDQYIYLLDNELNEVNRYSVSGSIESVSVSDEGVVAAGTSSNTVFAFNAEGGTLFSAKTLDVANAVSVNHDASYFAVADFAGNYYVLDQDGKEIWRKSGKGAGRAVQISPDSTTLYTGSGTGVVQKFDIGTVIAAAKQQKTVGKIVTAASVVLALLLVGLLLYWMKKRQKLGIFKLIWKEKYSYLMLLPSFFLIFVFMYYPAFSGLFHSFYDWNPGARSTFVGFENYQRMVKDPYVVTGVGNLILLIATGVFKTIVPPLLVAELIYFLSNKKAQYWFRTGFVTSMIIPSVAGLLIWQNLYDPNMGLINKTLELIGLGEYTHAWLGDPNTAIWAIIFIGFPFVSILSLLIFYAGLIAIPTELIESAKIDGASTGRIIRSIHLPLLAGQMKLLIILAFIGTIQDFGNILIVTGGGPMDSTYVPALQMYYAATIFNDLGYASALGVSMFLIILVLTIINMKFIRSEHD
jgi:ABC-type sugar transport system permease subunit/outer membrane protein assembly factor BamB